METLARALQTHGAAGVTEYLPERQCLRALAFWAEGGLVPDYEYFPEGVSDLFPGG